MSVSQSVSQSSKVKPQECPEKKPTTALILQEQRTQSSWKVANISLCSCLHKYSGSLETLAQVLAHNTYREHKYSYPNRNFHTTSSSHVFPCPQHDKVKDQAVQGALRRTYVGKVNFIIFSDPSFRVR